MRTLEDATRNPSWRRVDTPIQASSQRHGAKHIVFAEPVPGRLTALAVALQTRGSVWTALRWAAVPKSLDAEPPALLVIDVGPPDFRGQHLVWIFQTLARGCPILLICDRGEQKTVLDRFGDLTVRGVFFRPT